MTERDSMEVDIVCVGFGPATAGFLTTLSKGMVEAGLMLNVLAYERADDIGFGVSGVVTRARGIRETLPGIDDADVPTEMTSVNTFRFLFDEYFDAGLPLRENNVYIPISGEYTDVADRLGVKKDPGGASP